MKIVEGGKFHVQGRWQFFLEVAKTVMIPSLGFFTGLIYLAILDNR